MAVIPLRNSAFSGFLLAMVIAVMTVMPVCAQAAMMENRGDAIEEAQTQYEEIRERIQKNSIADPAAIEAELRDLREVSRGRLADIERSIEGVESQLAPLGPAPAEGEPPESASLASQRAALAEELAKLNGQKVQVNANIIEANDLLANIAKTRVQNLFDRLLDRGPSPLSPVTWLPASEEFVRTGAKVGTYFERWSAAKSENGQLSVAIGVIALALAGFFFFFGPVSRWIIKTSTTMVARKSPSEGGRVLVAGLRMIARTLPGVIGGFIIIESLRVQGIINEAGEGAAHALWFALIAYLLVSGFLRGLFALSDSNWRIAPIDTGKAKRVTTYILAVVIAFGAKMLLTEIFVATGSSGELIRLNNAFWSVLIGVFLFLLCRRKLWTHSQPVQPESEAALSDDEIAKHTRQIRFWRFARRLGRGFAIVMIFAALIGYVDLATFLASRIYFLTMFLAIAWLARAILREGAYALHRRTATQDHSGPIVKDGEHENFRFWIDWSINVCLAIALAPAILVLIGIPASNVVDIAAQAFFGFQIGSVRIPSLAKLIYAIAVFIALMAVTRAVQRAIQKGPFAHSNIDAGVQNSLVTLLGYAGLVIALFASVSAIGFDLGNLALIAGALSVGVGFGLQSIVNNFVSGLILLFERPIKAGDWIVTASGEGTVKRISVRSTEIETFDRSSIIIPNSELISSTVTNWTHKNRLGRIIVPIGVSYNSDPKKVKEILLKCAHDHPLIVRFPEPFVVWQEFGASSLDFEIRAFLPDISQGLNVRTELRFAIFAALKEAGIEIPFPQSDVHIKSVPQGQGASPATPKNADIKNEIAND